MARTTFRMLALVALALGLIGFGGVVTAHDEATPEGSPMAGDMGGGHGMGGSGAAYLIIDNAGESDVLIGGTTDVAHVVEIHEIADNDGVMEMKPLE